MVFSLAILLGAASLSAAPDTETDKATVHTIQLNDDTINPITAEYIGRAIEHAEEENAQCLVIKLDTPGGLLSSTRLIVKNMLAAEVPVVVYIGPSGSRAGSAGVFITYASHVAAMAPSTNIGAAHPVQMGGGEGKKNDRDEDLLKDLERLIEKNKEKGAEETKGKKAAKKDSEKKDAESEKPTEIVPDDDPMSSKILQDTVAFIKALAKLRGRNEEWAINSVTKSSSITETEALELKVVEIIAKSDDDLLAQLDGRTVKIGDKEVTLKTKEAVIKHIDMDFRQKFFNTLADPNIAYILMILGFYGLLYEVTHPGFGAPGILGAIFLILAFFSMQTLPTNYAALALIVLGLLLLVAEAATPGMGFMVLGGAVCLVLGSLLLFDTSSAPMMRVSLSIIFGFTVPTIAITMFLTRLAIKAHSRKAVSGQEGIIGDKGEAQMDLIPGREGKVYAHGELWNAVSDEEIKKGEKIVVTAIDNMTLTVKKLMKGDTP